DYVRLALDLGVEPSRIDTIVRFDAVQEYGVKAEGSAAGASAAVVAELAGLIAAGELEVPIAATFPLGQVRVAYRLLARGLPRAAGGPARRPRPAGRPAAPWRGPRATPVAPGTAGTGRGRQDQGRAEAMRAGAGPGTGAGEAGQDAGRRGWARGGIGGPGQGR